MHKIRFLLSLLSIFTTFGTLTVNGQEITGTVVNKSTGEPIPFAAVSLVKSKTNVTTDFEGMFLLPLPHKKDSLIVQTMGFEKFVKVVSEKDTKKALNIKLKEEGIVLEEAVVHMGEDPAYPIMRKVMERKRTNDPSRIPAVNYHKYNRMQIDIANISESFKEKKMMQKLGEELQDLDLLKDTSGQEYIPFFISETASDVYQTRNPERQKEIIKGSKVHGLGNKNADFWTQFSSNYFANYNFYDDIVDILDKGFQSPISNNWKGYYRYFLIDSTVLNGQQIYKIDIEPKRPQDLAFEGTIWIYDSTYALEKVELTLQQTANLNFIDNIYIKMRWQPTDTSNYFLKSSLLAFDLAEISEKSVSMNGKVYNEFSDIKLNAPSKSKFYQYDTEFDENSKNQDSTFWVERSPKEEIYKDDAKAFKIIEEVQDLPTVRSYLDIIEFLLNGHVSAGKFDIGPLLKSYAFNRIERHRFTFGGRTNINFSDKWQFTGYGAYGTGDEEWKYSFQADYFLSRKNWSYVGIQYRKELDLLGIPRRNNFPGLFNIFLKWGQQRGSYYYKGTEIYYYRQLNRHFATELSHAQYSMDPTFYFSYDNGEGEKTSLDISEVSVNLHFGYDEKYIVDDFRRRSVGTKYPELDVKYTAGLNNYLNGDYEFHKIEIKAYQKFAFANMGKAKFWLNVGKVFKEVPYPLLNIPIGNETAFYARFAMNTMNYFEFVSDQYIGFTYMHQFHGFLLNRIPLLRRLKWRAVGNFSILQGSISEQNMKDIPVDQKIFNTFSDTPYMEVGYGVENIFKFLRVQAYHRLTYRDNKDAQNFGIKVSAVISF